MPSYFFYPLLEVFQTVFLPAALSALSFVVFLHFWLSVLRKQLQKQIMNCRTLIIALPPPPEQKFVFQSSQNNSVFSPSTPTHNQSKYLFAPIKVAGVTFNNDDGTDRQLILRKLHFRDNPFSKYVDVEIKQYEFKGSPAYGIYANDMQIGNIPANLVPFMQDNIERIESISHIDVYGGGHKDGKPISYGCKIILRFLKDNPPINVPDTLKIND